MSSREEMLKKVRGALRGSPEGGRLPGGAIPEMGRVLDPIPSRELVDHFEAQFQAVDGVTHRADSRDALEQILQSILPAHDAGPVVLSRHPLLARLGLAARLQSLGYSITAWPAAPAAAEDGGPAFRQQCFSATAGITGASFAMAESGTLVLLSAVEGSQLVSLAPPVHIALYTLDQVVESLEEVLARLQADANQGVDGRSVVFVTGCSRTSDIEQVSIRGVHGPSVIHAILIEDTFA